MSNTPSYTPSYIKHAQDPSYPLDYILLYAYPTAFLGAMFFSIKSFMDVQPLSIFANNHVSIVLFSYIAVCGFVSLMYWYEYSKFVDVKPIIKSTSGIYNINTIKETSDS
jgi:hypothetical protein